MASPAFARSSRRTSDAAASGACARSPAGAPARSLVVGRWALLPRRAAAAEDARGAEASEERIEAAARLLLRRWGVVFREILARETLVPPWRALLGALRRL